MQSSVQAEQVFLLPLGLLASSRQSQSPIVIQKGSHLANTNESLAGPIYLVC